ncbi:hypothetical protein MANES_11G164401v8 [Manihot esculenta]|uniref:Uncharacterized protein n=1 Tax=Manihot esculenta TaxID=3983 RepID=A0ACB7GWM8_MANES|nr:hypothetical protein MANES_11G164401v8 [Manihot esculenta]
MTVPIETTHGNPQACITGPAVSSTTRRPEPKLRIQCFFVVGLLPSSWLFEAAIEMSPSSNSVLVSLVRDFEYHQQP